MNNLELNPNVEYLDKHQKEVHKNFPSDNKLSNPQYVYHLILWITFFRRNIHRFVIDYLQIRLYPYQIYMLYFLNTRKNSCIIAARSAAKSFCIAVFACARAMLYPNSRIVIASATLAQSRLIVSEKIKIELLDKSPALREAIAFIRDRSDSTLVKFHNGSSIKVVPASDNALGNRSTFLIIEEAARMNQETLGRVLMPFQINRQAGYLQVSPYEQMKYLHEEPIAAYISSSYMRNHWLIKDIALPYYKQMQEGQDSFLMCMDYAITLRHDIKPRSFIQEQKQLLDPMTFATEYENLAPSQSLLSYYSFDIVSKNQVLKKAFYPRKTVDYLSKSKNKYTIPRQQGEVRIISCDIAMMDKNGNDNSCYSCLRLLPEVIRNSEKNIEIHDYHIQVPYLEGFKGCETSKQAVRIRQLFEDFDADYIVLDMRAIGIPVYDALSKVLYDDERCVEYSPLYCMNDEILDNSRKNANPNALPLIYGFIGTPKSNSAMSIGLKNDFIGKRIDLLVNKSIGEEEINKIVPNYKNLSAEEQLWLEKPYLETMLLINELVNLEYEKLESTGLIRVHEKSNMCKDRYSSLAMGCDFASKLARDLFKAKENITIENAPKCVSYINF